MVTSDLPLSPHSVHSPLQWPVSWVPSARDSGQSGKQAATWASQGCASQFHCLCTVTNTGSWAHTTNGLHKSINTFLHACRQNIISKVTNDTGVKITKHIYTDSWVLWVRMIRFLDFFWFLPYMTWEHLIPMQTLFNLCSQTSTTNPSSKPHTPSLSRFSPTLAVHCHLIAVWFPGRGAPSWS